MPRPIKAQPFPPWQGDDAGALNWADLEIVRTAVAEIAPRWSTELNCAGPDDSTIVILPEGANDLLGPAFVLHRTKGHVRLDQFRWDEYRGLGSFGSLDDALRLLRARLASAVSLAALALSPEALDGEAS